jgi:hypothetical protein
MFEIDERTVRPESLLELVACDNVARPLQQRAKDLEGLLLQTDPPRASAQLARANVQFEACEADERGRLSRELHEVTPPVYRSRLRAPAMR